MNKTTWNFIHTLKKVTPNEKTSDFSGLCLQVEVEEGFLYSSNSIGDKYGTLPLIVNVFF